MKENDYYHVSSDLSLTAWPKFDKGLSLVYMGRIKRVITESYNGYDY